MRRLARILAIALHPVLMPCFLVGLLLYADPHIGFFLPMEARWLMLMMLVVMTVLFPLISVLLMRKARLITDLELPRREERIAPYLFTLLYQGMALYLLYRTPIHPIVYALFIGILIAVLASLLITLRWKISAHLVGIGGLIGGLFADQLLLGANLFLPLVCAILGAGMLGTARLLTSDHSHAQILVGGGLGAACTFGSALLLD